MLAILRITFPFFALIGAGYVCVVRRWLPRETVGSLNLFVLYVALPCMLFTFSAGLVLPALWRQPVLVIYGFVALSLFAGLLLWGRLRGISWRDLSFVSLVGVFPNTGFIGVPLLVAMIGSRAATPAIAIVLFDTLLTSSCAVATSTLDGQGPSSLWHALRGAARGVVSNPMLWSILAGIAFAVGHVTTDTIWLQPVWLMADAATPVALFTTGGILARARLDRPAGSRVQPVTPFVLAKLGVHPLLVYGGVLAARVLGSPLEGWMGDTLVLMAALPSAANVSFLADRMGGDSAWVARVILWTTTGAFATFAMWGAWLARGT